MHVVKRELKYLDGKFGKYRYKPNNRVRIGRDQNAKEEK